MTQGTLTVLPDGSLQNDGAKLRAVAGEGGGRRRAELAFVLRGEAPTPAPLASGELRRQLGLKLRADDGCNLVTVMWRTAQPGALVVAVKRNAGLHDSHACGARGTARVEPRSARELAAPRIGEAHRISAEQKGELLRVEVDGVPAWEGTLPPAARGLSGPAGLRSDNLRWRGRLALDPAPVLPARCH